MSTSGRERFKVFEEVFDEATCRALYKLVTKGLIGGLGGVVKAGKEARIYWAEGPRGEELAVKIYLTTTAEFWKSRWMYIEGDRRFRKVKRTTRSIVYAWATKEYKNLVKAYEAGVRVPKPIAVHRNVLVMEFLGKNRVPAPLMKEVKLEDPGAAYRALLDCIKKLYTEAGLVHGDLSEYNVMIWENEPVIFDISQAVPTSHPMADELLMRDIKNLNAYFAKLKVNVLPLEQVYEWVKHG